MSIKIVIYFFPQILQIKQIFVFIISWICKICERL